MKDTIIVDLDGTLCDHSHRLQWALSRDWKQYNSWCHLDTPHKEVVETVRLFREAGYKILVVTGRPEELRATSRCWLDHYAPGRREGMLMRPLEDMRHDYELKLSMIEQHFGSKQNVLDHVLLALEDRDQVTQAYRAYGLNVMQVRNDATGDFNHG